MPYAFDDQGDPLITMHLHGWMTENDLGSLLGDVARLVARGTPFAVVFDCTGLRVPDLVLIRRLTAWFDDHQAETAGCHRGVACVITTPMIRGTLRAVLQLQTMPMPIVVVETVEDGHAWCRQQLEAPTA